MAVTADRLSLWIQRGGKVVIFGGSGFVWLIVCLLFTLGKTRKSSRRHDFKLFEIAKEFMRVKRGKTKALVWSSGDSNLKLSIFFLVQTLRERTRVADSGQTRPTVLSTLISVWVGLNWGLNTNILVRHSHVMHTWHLTGFYRHFISYVTSVSQVADQLESQVANQSELCLILQISM